MRTIARQTGWAALLLVAAAGVTFSASVPQRGKPMNTPAGSVKWEPYAPGNPLQVAMVWGDRTKPGDYAMLLKVPAGFEAGRHSHTNDYHGVTIQGSWVHTNDGDKPHDLPPGSVVLQPGKQVHNDACKGTTDCIILVHQQGPEDFIPAK